MVRPGSAARSAGLGSAPLHLSSGPPRGKGWGPGAGTPEAGPGAPRDCQGRGGATSGRAEAAGLPPARPRGGLLRLSEPQLPLQENGTPVRATREASRPPGCAGTLGCAPQPSPSGRPRFAENRPECV
ncbi:translation initiation factor IF-2-like [Rhinolophus ferrumequinum]|uniref:translation initiation factor IF-2-like n=1 Tax=Rhinolophus ferrumequinum TaxID=59479 RepID=UPI00140FBB5C|nr:translation initiation factor IF-2-like [Rhinolophus ferrumequinum]